MKHLFGGQPTHGLPGGALVDGGPVLVYASADPDRVQAAQQALGVARAGALVEQALGRLSRTLVDEGVGRLVVAGKTLEAAVYATEERFPRD
ncbi:nucleotide-binding domain containing protein [Halomonas tibetensis]|uniref:Nucleotide-binding domain containing protein n=1 Tax=Halomonas tibetensis TaxID=2259590 RepID=A0ABV7B893_9GAMM